MDYQAIAVWALGDGVGASAKCIARHMLGMTTSGSYPHDCGDFGRCEALLKAVPEFRDRLHELANVNAYWAALVPRWQEIRDAEDKYKLIQSILRPQEDKDARIFRLDKGVTVRFGRP